MSTLPPTLSCRKTQQPFKKTGVMIFNWYTNPWRDNGGNAPGFITDCSVFTFSVSGDTTSLGVCRVFKFLKNYFQLRSWFGADGARTRDSQDFSQPQSFQGLWLTPDPDGWAAVQGTTWDREMHGMLSLGTHHSKNENVKARPKKVEKDWKCEDTKKGGIRAPVLLWRGGHYGTPPVEGLF